MFRSAISGSFTVTGFVLSPTTLSSFDVFDLLGMVVLGVAALTPLSLWISVRLWQRLAVMRQRVDSAEQETAVLREALATASDGYYAWFRDGPDRGAEVCSRRLAVLLRLVSGGDARFSEIVGGFTQEDGALLERAVDCLHADGVGFVLDLTLTATGRRVRALGVRASTEDNVVLADMVWMRDVTEEARATEILGRRADTLQQDRDRLRALLDSLPLMVWLRDESLAVVEANATYAAALDLPVGRRAGAEDAGGRDSGRHELAPGVAGQEMRALAARSRAAGTASRGRFHVVLSGERRLVEIVETPAGSGPLAGHTVGAAFDVTPLEEMEARLAREAEAQAEVLERLGTAIAVFDAETRLTFHNTAFAHLWSLDTEWLDQRPGYGAFLERLRENRRLPEVADFPAFKGGELAHFTKLLRPREDILHLPDGTTLRRVLAPHPLGGLLATYEDVTDSLALERSYNQLTAVQRETLDNLHEAVAVFGPNGRLRLSNPTFGRLWDLDLGLGAGEDGAPEDGVGNDGGSEALQLADLLVRQEASVTPGEAWETFKRRMMAQGEGRGPRTGRITLAAGHHMDYATVPLPDGGLLLTLLDVTDRVRVEQALRDRTDALRAADMLKSAFIANVSFELRTPLTTISGFSEILEGGYYGTLNSRQAEYAQVIANTARQMVTLIDDITDLVSIEAGNLSLELDAFDVHAALAAVLALSRETARRRDVTVHFDCPPEAGWVVGDERRIKQILYHLLSNAIAASEPGKSVVLAAQRQGADQILDGLKPIGECIVFTVADTGIGMDDSTRRAVLTAFAKGPHSEGAGLGLTLVRRFVDLHGGDLDIVSVPGEGTTVTVRIPVGS